MVRRSSILASDADRERVAERLRQATAEGRILAHELEERLGRALRARTYGELDELVADLPRTAVPGKRRSRSMGLARSHPVAAVAVLVVLTVMIAAAAAMALFAFSGVWFLLVLVLVLRRGPWSGGASGRYRGYRGAPYGARRGRHPYWVP
jgi:Flp pilus assembly protein TadB